MEKKTAFITGFTGQDGTFLARHLLDNGYKVIGLVRRISTEPPRRVRGKFDFSEEIREGSLELVEGDMGSVTSLIKIIEKYKPSEVYNLAWQSHVGLSFKVPEVSLADLQGFVNLITAIENEMVDPWYRPRIYQASTSEMFGDYYKDNQAYRMGETTPFRPNSPYAIAKMAAHQYAVMKREQGVHISSGILFNHESEIRGGDFVTQKIARGAVRFDREGIPLELGNLNAGRDWGYAGDYVKAMHAMLQQETAEDYVIATGKTRTVRQFVEFAFNALNMQITWEGEGKFEVGRTVDGKIAVMVSDKYYRPNDVNYLNGDSSKAHEKLGWEPTTSFEEMVKIMTEAAAA